MQKFSQLIGVIFLLAASSLINDFFLASLVQNLLIYHLYASKQQNLASLFLACLSSDIVTIMPWGARFFSTCLNLAIIEKFCPNIASQKLELAVKGAIFILLNIMLYANLV